MFLLPLIIWDFYVFLPSGVSGTINGMVARAFLDAQESHIMWFNP